jgi:DNA-binding response OmpR family regulator
VGNKILVVDDEPSITSLLEYNLRRNGYEVLVARDGRTALQLAEAERPDLIILDLMLPGLDGLEAADFSRYSIGRREEAIAQPSQSGYNSGRER